MTMCQSVQSSNFMTNHVSCPVLRYPHCYKSVQCHSGRKHKIRHQLIIMLVLTNLRSYFHQSLQNSLRPTVHHTTLSGGSHILFHYMNECICQSAGYLMGRQSKGYFRIEDRKQREVGIERIFLFGFVTGDNSSVIHFRTCSRECQYGRKRNGFGYRASGKYQVPGITVVQQTCGNQLRTINNRTATHS